MGLNIAFFVCFFYIENFYFGKFLIIFLCVCAASGAKGAEWVAQQNIKRVDFFFNYFFFAQQMKLFYPAFVVLNCKLILLYQFRSNKHANKGGCRPID